MTVLVTGGAGYIGSHTVLALAEAGEDVVVIDDLSTGFSAYLPEGVPLFIGDAGDENLLEGVIAQHDIDSIIHFAGSVVVPDSMRDPLGYYRNNFTTARNLLNVAVKAATGQRAKIDVFGTDYPTQDGSCIRDFIHVTDLSQAHRSALAYLRNGGASTTLNCGYGRGYSVLETIDAVRRVSGRSFAVQYASRRPGDIMTMVADTSRIRGLLDWKPQYDDLETIAAHALAWEDKLFRERHGELRHAASA